MSNRYRSKYAKAINRMLYNSSCRTLLGLKVMDWIEVRGNVPKAIVANRYRIPVTLRYGKTEKIKTEYSNPLYQREALKQIRGLK